MKLVTITGPHGRMYISVIVENAAVDAAVAFAGVEDTTAVSDIAATKIQCLKSVRDTRRQFYPPSGDFADALYWESKGDAAVLAAYYAKCEFIKTSFPKPVSMEE